MDPNEVKHYCLYYVTNRGVYNFEGGEGVGVGLLLCMGHKKMDTCLISDIYDSLRVSM